MKVDAYSSLSHYSGHIRPVWEALPPSLRGGWWTPANLPRSDRLTIVASYRDAQTIGRPYVLIEHGAGQRYVGHERNGSYPGGEGHDGCVLFLCPSERVAGLWQERYPNTPAKVVGCPRLDRYADRRDEQPRACPTPERAGSPTPSHRQDQSQRGSNRPEGVSVGPPAARVGPVDFPGSRAGQPFRAGDRSPSDRSVPKRSEASSPPRQGDGALVPPPSRPSVAVTFHADLAVCPETHSAWRYYDPHLPRLCADPRYRVVGHGHPRLWPTIRRRWEELGVERWPDVDRVLSEADVLVADNTSVLYEACALGIPTVCLNLPSYRRDVEHGGRFWTAPPGIQVDHPTELADAIACALTDPPAHRAIRARAVTWAYSVLDGHASERAAAAITEVLSGL